MNLWPTTIQTDVRHVSVMNNTVIEIIRYASNFSIIAPILVYFAWRKSLPAPQHVIGLLVVVSGLTDVISMILFRQQMSTVLVSNLYGLLLFGLLSYFYFRLYIRDSYNENHRSLFFTGTVVYCLCLAITIFLQGLYQYQDLLRAFGGLIIIAYSVAYFNFIHKGGPVAAQLNGSLWFVGSIIYYFATSIAIFVLFQYLITKTEPDIMRAIWSVHNVSNVIKNVVFALGFYYTARAMKLRSTY